jgi:hypothetical protein
MSINPLWAVSHFRDDGVGATRAAASAKSAARQAQDAASDLEERLDKLSLICMAMWELIRQKTDLGETDLLAKVQELDLRDGAPDGKLTRRVAKCPHCDRTMSPRHQKCLYCGYEKLVGSVFEGM